MGNRVICINRRYGSAGSEIGKAAAEKLGIKFYDKDLLAKAIEYGGLEETKAIKAFLGTEEKAPNKFTYRLYDIGNEHVEKESPAADIIYDLERQLIIKAAQESDCIIMGRCAGEILAKEDCQVIRVFITASEEHRERYIDENSDTDISLKEAKKQMEHVDKNRAEFFKNYTGKEWADSASYDVVLNSENLGVALTVEMICGMYHHMI